MSSLDESLGAYLTQVDASKQRNLEYIRREQAAHTRAFNYVDASFRQRMFDVEMKLRPHVSFTTYPPITKGIEVLYRIDLSFADGLDASTLVFRINGDTSKVLWGPNSTSFEDALKTDAIEGAFAVALSLRAQRLKTHNPNDPQDEHG